MYVIGHILCVCNFIREDEEGFSKYKLYVHLECWHSVPCDLKLISQTTYYLYVHLQFSQLVNYHCVKLGQIANLLYLEMQ